jgi:hypothetical protein
MKILPLVIGEEVERVSEPSPALAAGCQKAEIVERDPAGVRGFREFATD